jgi:hypothetical protein
MNWKYRVAQPGLRLLEKIEDAVAAAYVRVWTWTQR